MGFLMLKVVLPSGREHEFTGKFIKIDSAGRVISTSSSNHLPFKSFNPIFLSLHPLNPIQTSKTIIPIIISCFFIFFLPQTFNYTCIMSHCAVFQIIFYIGCIRGKLSPLSPPIKYGVSPIPSPSASFPV